jgi:hypothetical protein
MGAPATSCGISLLRHVVFGNQTRRCAKFTRKCHRVGPNRYCQKKKKEKKTRCCPDPAPSPDPTLGFDTEKRPRDSSPAPPPAPPPPPPPAAPPSNLRLPHLLPPSVLFFPPASAGPDPGRPHPRAATVRPRRQTAWIRVSRSLCCSRSPGEHILVRNFL